MAKTIRGSVGVGGANRAADVFTVQYLLNLVPVGKGGPSPELVVDAICGPLTKAAIQKFQRASGSPCDGRVDPGGPTFRKLLTYDPYPAQDLTAAMAGKIGKAGSTAQKAAAEVIIRKIGEELARQHGKWLEVAPLSGKSWPGLEKGAATAKGIADIIAKATLAAGKIVHEAAKQGGLPVGPNPFAPPSRFKIQEITMKAYEAAQKVAQEAMKQAGGVPGAGPLIGPAVKAHETAAKAAQSIADAAVKAAESVAKWGSSAPVPPPAVKLPIGELNSKVTSIIKQTSDAVGKLVEGAAKAASKLA